MKKMLQLHCISPSSSSPLPFVQPFSSHSLQHSAINTSSVLANRTKPASTTRLGKQLRIRAVIQSEESPPQDEDEEEHYQVLTVIQSFYNHIVILDTPNSRLLLLDSSNSVHSMINKDSNWTRSYWDENAALPPIVPPGPIAIFGLGAGTSAHLMLELWPSLQLEGWEIDEIVIEKSRDFLGLSNLEKHNSDGGVLNIHIGDVFSPSATIAGGYSGIIVDLFIDGKVLPQLEKVDTWLELYGKLMPNGRLMVNCGAGQDILPHHDESSVDGNWKLNATIMALCEAFPGQVNWKKMPLADGANYLALTGSLPDLTTWTSALPIELSSSISQWKACDIDS